MGQSEPPIEALRAIPRASVRERERAVERALRALRSGELEAALGELSRPALADLLGELDATSDRIVERAGPAMRAWCAALLAAGAAGALARLPPVACWVAAAAVAAAGLAWDRWSARRASRLADRLDLVIRRLDQFAARPSTMSLHPLRWEQDGRDPPRREASPAPRADRPNRTRRFDDTTLSEVLDEPLSQEPPKRP